jgi:hypothetical protein
MNLNSCKIFLRIPRFISKPSKSLFSKRPREKPIVIDPELGKHNFFYNDLEFYPDPISEYSSDKNLTHDQIEQLWKEMSERYPSGKVEIPKIKVPDKMKHFTRYADYVEDPELKHIFQFPRNEPFKRRSAVELFHIPKVPEHQNNINRLLQYLPELLPPQSLKDESLLKIQENYKHFSITHSPPEEFDTLKSTLLETIPKLNYTLIPDLTLYLTFTLQLNDKEIWQALRHNISSNLSLFTIEEICKMQYSELHKRPHFLGKEVTGFFYTQALQAIRTTNSLHTMLLILQAFKNKESLELSNLTRTIFIQRKQELLKLNSSSEQSISQSETESERESEIQGKLISEILYTWASTKPPLRKYGVKKQYHYKDIDELLIHYETHLIQFIPKMEIKDVLRVVTAFYLLRRTDFDNVLWRAEEVVIRKSKEIDAFCLAGILRAFSKMNQQAGFGKDKTFVQLEPFVIQKMSEFQLREFSYVVYAYGNRGQGNPELHQCFMNRINEDVEKMDYPTLFNILYYLMFRDIKDEDLWKRIMKRTIEIPEILPILYYRPFKMSKFFLKHHFPEWDLIDYQDKFWWSERYFNAVQLETNYEKCEEYNTFKSFINVNLQIMPAMFLTLHNLITVNFGFKDLKIGINLHLDRNMIPGTERVNGMSLLPGKLLRYEGWELLDLYYNEFYEMGKYSAINLLREWFKVARDNQIDKGIIPKSLPKYV